MTTILFMPGQRGSYPFSALPLTEPPPVSAVYAYVRRTSDGKCEPLYIGQAENAAQRWRDHLNDGLHRQALGLGANELHIHLLATTKEMRLNVETDLRRNWPTPLNRQGSPAYAKNALTGLLGLGASNLNALTQNNQNPLWA